VVLASHGGVALFENVSAFSLLQISQFSHKKATPALLLRINPAALSTRYTVLRLHATTVSIQHHVGQSPIAFQGMVHRAFEV
jgi:hypothetical protein